jgi:hypothetical protein
LVAVDEKGDGQLTAGTKKLMLLKVRGGLAVDRRSTATEDEVADRWRAVGVVVEHSALEHLTAVEV